MQGQEVIEITIPWHLWLIPRERIMERNHSGDRLPNQQRAVRAVQYANFAIPRLRRKRELLPNLKAVPGAIE